MSGAAPPLASTSQVAAASRPPLAIRPWIGIVAVLLGACIATITGRLSAFGINDIRGALHAGVDEGAWILTASTVAQMLIGPAAGWAGMVYGPRRVLFWTCLLFAAASTGLPFARDLPSFLVLQFVAGLGSGAFVPLTISFVVRNLPPRLWAYGIAAYALNLEFSLHVAASLEGWYIEHLSWRWIFWQGVPLALAMAVCVWRGIPPQAVDRALRARTDWFGIAFLGAGLSLIYAALDQGNRLDWLSSGLVVGLLAGGSILLTAFFVHERSTASPWLNIRVATTGNLPILMVLIAGLRLLILSTAYVVPQFLGTVQGYRALETGRVLMWIAIPQLVIAPFAGWLLRRVDARYVIATGLCLAGAACWIVAQTLTREWGTAEFLPSQLMLAMGQSFAMSGVVFFAILNLRPQDAITFGALLQIARLFGGQLGTAFITTWTRVREQVASAGIGQHLQSGDAAVAQRLQEYAASVQGQSTGPAQAAARATALLSGAVRTQANVQSYIESFAILAVVVASFLLLVVILRPAPPNPAAHTSRR